MVKTVPRWDGAALSVRGAKHVVDGRPCQDASSHIFTTNGYAALLVADGAGSSEHSQLGSRAAVATASAVLLRGITNVTPATADEWRNLLFSSAGAARVAIDRLSNQDRPIRTLATTLLLMVLGPDSVCTLSVGDCSGIVSDLDGECHLVSPPESGEYVNQTYFLTESDWHTHARFGFWEGTARYGVAISDGLEFIAMKKGLPFVPFLDGMVGQLAQLTAPYRRAALSDYLSEYVSGIRTDDDISFLTAWRS